MIEHMARIVAEQTVKHRIMEIALQNYLTRMIGDGLWGQP